MGTIPGWKVAIAVAAIGLQVVVNFVVLGTLRGDKLRVEDVSAIGRPMLYPEDVVIFDYAVNNKERFSAPQFSLQFWSEEYLFSFYRPMLNSPKTFLDLPEGENGTSLNDIVGMSGRIGEIKQLAFLEYSYNDIPTHVFSRSLAAVNQLRWNREGFFSLKSKRAFHEFKSHPSSFISPEIFLGCFIGPLHLSPHLIGVIGVFAGDYQQSASKDGSKKSGYKIPPLKPFVLSLFGLGFLAYGWWRIRFDCHSERQWWFGLCASLIGVTLWMYGFSGFLDWRFKF
jgi:hypothetical protein